MASTSELSTAAVHDETTISTAMFAPQRRGAKGAVHWEAHEDAKNTEGPLLLWSQI
jgi:hypothetical protein